MFPQPTKATRSRRGDGDMLGEGSGGIAGVAGESNAVVSVFPHAIAIQQVKPSQSQFCHSRTVPYILAQKHRGEPCRGKSRFHHWRRGGVNASVPRNDTKAEADGPHSPTLRRLRGANKR
jgi:hypothetical protein